MLKSDLLSLLKQVASGQKSISEAYAELSLKPYETLSHGLKIDHQRGLRTGLDEAIFGQGKTLLQLETAITALATKKKPALVTKLSQEHGHKLAEKFAGSKYFDIPQIFIQGKDIELNEPWPEKGDVLIISAGGADLSIALETYATAKFFDLNVGLISDVGVAGLHRIVTYMPLINQAKILIVVAGMEGALPSVLGGLTDKPIIGVPTSVGYGTNFNGLAPMLAMLNSCAPGLAIVNIDNGFGAACLANKIIKNQ
ncbi:nickel pincer cofactor biosynthesis protein LarB [Desulfovulcanus sp.]